MPWSSLSSPETLGNELGKCAYVFTNHIYRFSLCGVLPYIQQTNTTGASNICRNTPCTTCKAAPYCCVNLIITKTRLDQGRQYFCIHCTTASLWLNHENVRVRVLPNYTLGLLGLSPALDMSTQTCYSPAVSGLYELRRCDHGRDAHLRGRDTVCRTGRTAMPALPRQL